MHTAKLLSGFLAAHGLEIVRTSEANELDDALIELKDDLIVQICDYPIRDGGLYYVLVRYFYKDGRFNYADEIGQFDDRFTLLKKILVELA